MKLIFLAVLILSSCFFGCSRLVKTESPLIPGSGIIVENITATLTKTDGNQLSLNTVPEDNTILVYASDTCIVCSEEAEYWKNEFAVTGLPKNVRFIHVLIGSIIEDAQDWAVAHGATWEVAIEPGDATFREFCPQKLTPCILVINNRTHEVFRKYGSMRKEEMETRTGTWVY